MEKCRILYYRIFQLSCEILHIDLANAYKQKDFL